MAFGGDKPQVSLLNLETGQRETLGEGRRHDALRRASRRTGRHVVMSLSDGSNSGLYEMDLGSKQTRRLTDDSAIDTSPSYSPDGSQIVSRGDRGGEAAALRDARPSGGEAKRSRSATGAIRRRCGRPRATCIAFTRQKDAEFGHRRDEAGRGGELHYSGGVPQRGADLRAQRAVPDVLPRPGGAGGAHIYMADIFGHGEFQVPTPAYASDPSWGPLLEVRDRPGAGDNKRLGGVLCPRQADGRSQLPLANSAGFAGVTRDRAVGADDSERSRPAAAAAPVEGRAGLAYRESLQIAVLDLAVRGCRLVAGRNGVGRIDAEKRNNGKYKRSFHDKLSSLSSRFAA